MNANPTTTPVVGIELDGEALREAVRTWAVTHVPPDWRVRMRGADDDQLRAFQRDWFERLRAAGLLVPHWPRRWGGGFSLRQQAIIAEELARVRAPQLSINSIALYHAAATLLHAGSDAQRERHLPAILAGEVWCQGFSEPNAGSDLAALQTRARRSGDGWVLDGQKIWSSYAQYADFCLLLARTDAAAPKRKGISCFVLDMRAPGVEVRPIRQSTGDEEFCEIFLTDVTIGPDALVGDEHAGWRVAQQTLAAERSIQVIDQVERLCATRSELAADLAERMERLDARGLGGAARQDLGRLCAETEILRVICGRMLDELDRTGGVGPQASVVKLLHSETLQRLGDAGTRWTGLDAQRERPLQRGASWETGDWLIDYISSWAWTVGGGTSEILRNVIAERVLGLPREPSPEASR